MSPHAVATSSPARTRDDGAAWWRGRDLLGIHGTPVERWRAILSMARAMSARAVDPGMGGGELAGRAIATLFFEDSTRTKTSFALAAQRLGATVVDLAVAASSVNKGETIVDTAINVEAMGISGMVVRARHSGAAGLVASAVRCPVFNAGDGRHEHPTQALLDALTIAERFGRGDGFDLTGLTVGIVGDLSSSRVCRSNVALLTMLGARVVCVGPASLAPAALRTLAARAELCEVRHELDGVIGSLDAIMMLRVQFERHGEEQKVAGEPAPRATPAIPSLREYRAIYSLTREREGRLKDGAIVMHPGPMNRGLEIDAEVADGPRSVILTQVSRGVAVRMACLAACVGV